MTVVSCQKQTTTSKSTRLAKSSKLHFVEERYCLFLIGERKTCQLGVTNGFPRTFLIAAHLHPGQIQLHFWWPKRPECFACWPVATNFSCVVSHCFVPQLSVIFRCPFAQLPIASQQKETESGCCKLQRPDPQINHAPSTSKRPSRQEKNKYFPRNSPIFGRCNPTPEVEKGSQQEQPLPQWCFRLPPQNNWHAKSPQHSYLITICPIKFAFFKVQ